MEFAALKKETVMVNPKKKGQLRRVESEIRRDPLTGRTARICHFMKLQWEKPDFDEMVAKGGSFCPFCAEHVEQVTPLFPPEIIPEGRLSHKDMWLFPNLAPYDSMSAVATLGSEHYVPMTAFSIDKISDGFRLAMDFFRRLDAIGHPESIFHLINWNYMPVSGSSLIHPHLQVFAASVAPNLMAEELTSAKFYADRAGTNFWDDLIAQEQAGQERYLGRLGRTHWLSAYAPMGVAGDVLAVVEDVHCTLQLTDEDLRCLADGLTRVMQAYDGIGIHSFNMNFFTGSRDDTFTRFHLLFSPRTFFNQALGTPDVGALRNLYNETLCMAYPEEINAIIKPTFA